MTQSRWCMHDQTGTWHVPSIFFLIFFSPVTDTSRPCLIMSPTKKTVTSQFHSTLIGTRILKGQNGGRRIRNREARRSRLMKINGCKGRKAMDWKSRVTEGEDWILVSIERNKNLIQNIRPKNAGTSNWRCGCQYGIGERIVEGTGWCSCWIWWVQGGCARCFK